MVREGQPIDVTIRGTGFDATANTVTVGPVILTAVRSTGGGTVIALSLPEMIILRKVLKLPLIATFAGVVALGILAVGYVFNAVL